MTINLQSGKPECSFNYSITSSHYGPILLAWHQQELCYLGFTDNLSDIKQRWPKVALSRASDIYSAAILKEQPVNLCLYGTDFEHRVWRALLDITCGSTVNYSDIARVIGQPTAQRATASAIGRNPISLLVPCHRVLRQSGELGGYHWGLHVKQQILAREAQHHM